MASQRPSHEYVLGTHGAERDRLALVGPAGFVRSYSRRLLELGRVDEPWVRAVNDEIARAAARPDSMLVAPTLLEVVAVRR